MLLFVTNKRGKHVIHSVHLLREGGEKSDTFIIQYIRVKAKPVNDTPWTQSIHIRVQLLRVLFLPVLIAE